MRAPLQSRPKPIRDVRRGETSSAQASEPVAQRVTIDQPGLRGIGGPRETVADYARSHSSGIARTTAPPNHTGLSDELKSGIESLSGVAMDDVRVHRNSASPGRIGAHAYAQGNEIHLAPGEDRHLPHEAWHVVQQKRGRVHATARVEGGPSYNDDPALELEADAMGARALAIDLPGAPSRPLHVASPAASEAPVQGVWVKRKTGHGKDAPPGPWIPAREGEEGAQDTRTMKIAERGAVRSDLNLIKTSDRQGQTARKELDEEIRLISGDINEEDILALSAPLAELQAAAARGPLVPAERRRLEEISFAVVRALSLLREHDDLDADATKLQLVLEAYVRQINAIDDNALSGAIVAAESDVDLHVTAEDIAAYRGDIAERGVWGSGAEASAIATAFNFRCRILILSRTRRYVQVDTIGPPGGAARNIALLNVGAHYQIVNQHAQPGGAFSEADVVYNPADDGDCLFRALHYIAAGGAATVADNAPPNAPLDEEAFVARARTIVSTGMTDADVTNSIVEIRNSRSRAGLGPRLRARMNMQDLSVDDLRARLRRTDKADVEMLNRIQTEAQGTPFEAWAGQFKALGGLLKAYEKVRSDMLSDPSPDISEKRRATHLGNANVLRDLLLTSIAKAMPPVEEALVESEGQDATLETKLRRDSRDQLERSGIKMTPSPSNPHQMIVTRDGHEFVMDRIGQLIPRYVHRGISDFNEAELKQDGHLYPTALSPIPKSRKGEYDQSLKSKFAREAAVSASGIGANKIKASQEMGHVEGVKPSPFLSTTGIAGGTMNPQGQTFGSSVRVIDLAYLPPSAIAATYTDRGMGYFLLSAFKGTAEEKASLIAHASEYEERQSSTRQQMATKPSTKAFTADDAATADSRISGKEWQALMDVIRTQEILISAPIPDAAVQHPKK
ncbi:MAG: eCIS core domain-containing protein [Sphingomonas oligoaromativorans]